MANFEKIAQRIEDLLKTKFCNEGSLIAIILTFINGFCKTDILNPRIEKVDLKVKRQYFVTVFMKFILDFELLRSLCLMPPRGCSLGKWQCFAGPCQSSDKSRCQSLRVIKTIRYFIGKEDDICHDFYQDYVDTWGKFHRSKSMSGVKAMEHYAPLILFPVKYLHPSVKEFILKEKPSFDEIIDELFVCPEHFKINSKTHSKWSYQSYSLEFLNEGLGNGEVSFTYGRKGWKTFAYMDYRLNQKILENRGFEDLPLGLLENTETIFLEIANQVDKMTDFTKQCTSLTQFYESFGQDDPDLVGL